MVFALGKENNQILYFVLTAAGLGNARAAKRLVETTVVPWMAMDSLPVCTFCHKVRFELRLNV